MVLDLQSLYANFQIFIFNDKKIILNKIFKLYECAVFWSSPLSSGDLTLLPGSKESLRLLLDGSRCLKHPGEPSGSRSMLEEGTISSVHFAFRDFSCHKTALEFRQNVLIEGSWSSLYPLGPAAVCSSARVFLPPTVPRGRPAPAEERKYGCSKRVPPPRPVAFLDLRSL